MFNSISINDYLRSIFLPVYLSSVYKQIFESSFPYYSQMILEIILKRGDMVVNFGIFIEEYTSLGTIN